MQNSWRSGWRLVGLGSFFPTYLLSHPHPIPPKKGTKGCSSAALPLQGRHWLPTSRVEGRQGRVTSELSAIVPLSLIRGWMSVREEV